MLRPGTRTARWPAAALAASALAASAAASEIDFNRDIRPILSDNCFYCHGQDGNKRKAGLRLDVREAAVGSGAITPGDAGASELIARVRSGDPDESMPPPGSNRHLSEDEKALLGRWVAEGAPYQEHWAFVPPGRPPEPAVANEAWVKNPVDRFVVALLEKNGAGPSPEADRATLIKRLYADLAGVPPSPEEVDAFVADGSPGAYEALVDRLLASPRFGERLALPWLDAARYADSNGFQQDGDTWQWIWRDWVVRALNDDLPFDDFTVWQLAGDLLPHPTTDQLIASGFNRNHLLNGEGGAIPEEQRYVILFDRVDTTTTTWLGLTVSCAQCHDHKYDPITLRDYYSLMDAFNRVPETGTPQRQSARIRVAKPFLELPTEGNKKKIAEFESKIAEAEGRTSGAGATEGAEKEVEKLKKELAGYRGDQVPKVMVMSDAKPRQTSILDRGQYLSPVEPVAFDTPQFLPGLPDGAPRNRLGLARWLVAEGHPLTARVQVNRMWQHFFGTGIVKTAEDFGVQSAYPVHRDLLDWLAVEFQSSGWSMKRMHRLIVTSATYRQSSKMGEWHLAHDRENRLYARASRLRMPSMVLRDWALGASGLLAGEVGGAPVYPYQPDNVWEALAITKERDFTYPASAGADLYRRSLYTFWRRTVSPTNMFDSSDRQACRVRQGVTSTPLHALTTLNDPTWVEAARTLAARVMAEEDDLDGRIARAFRHVACRRPEAADLDRLRSSFLRQKAFFRDDVGAAEALLAVGSSPRDPGLDAVDHAAMTAVCLGVLNLDESLTRE